MCCGCISYFTYINYYTNPISRVSPSEYTYNQNIHNQNKTIKNIYNNENNYSTLNKSIIPNIEELSSSSSTTDTSRSEDEHYYNKLKRKHKLPSIVAESGIYSEVNIQRTDRVLRSQIYSPIHKTETSI